MELNLNPQSFYPEGIIKLECPKHGQQTQWMRLKEGSDKDGFYCIHCMLENMCRLSITYKGTTGKE